jgi:hypothetical protein
VIAEFDGARESADRLYAEKFLGSFGSPVKRVNP